jgi:hypothetical protein
LGIRDVTIGSGLLLLVVLAALGITASTLFRGLADPPDRHPAADGDHAPEAVVEDITGLAVPSGE